MDDSVLRALRNARANGWEIVGITNEKYHLGKVIDKQRETLRLCQGLLSKIYLARKPSECWIIRHAPKRFYDRLPNWINLPWRSRWINGQEKFIGRFSASNAGLFRLATAHWMIGQGFQFKIDSFPEECQFSAYEVVTSPNWRFTFGMTRDQGYQIGFVGNRLLYHTGMRTAEVDEFARCVFMRGMAGV